MCACFSSLPYLYRHLPPLFTPGQHSMEHFQVSAHPSSAHPSSAHPSSAHPGSAHPSSAHPGSAHPSSAYSNNTADLQTSRFKMSVCLSSLWNKDHTHTPFRHHCWLCSDTIIIAPPIMSCSIAALSPLVALSMRCHGVQHYSKKIKPFTSIKLRVASCYSCKY